MDMEGTQFQILHVAQPISEKALSGLSGLVYVETEDHRQLVYANPDTISRASSQLEYFGLRGAVLPDYALAAVAKNCRTFGFTVTDIDLPTDRVLQALCRELLTTGRTDELQDLLKEIRVPISAIHLRYQEFDVKLQGAGLVTISSPGGEYPQLVREILEGLTFCLFDALHDFEYKPLSIARANVVMV